MAEDFLKKLDPSLRQRLNDGTLQGPIELLVQTDSLAPEDGTRLLEEAGLNIETTIGNVVGGRVKDADALKAVAQLAGVRLIEGSRTLFRE